MNRAEWREGGREGGRPLWSVTKQPGDLLSFLFWSPRPRSFMKVPIYPDIIFSSPPHPTSITRGEKRIEFGGFSKLNALRETVLKIQNGEIPDTHGWCQDV